MSRSFIVIILAFHILVWSHICCYSGSFVDALSSIWSPAMWKITLNLGKDSLSSSSVESMPDSWGESGARLAFAMDVIVEPDRDKDEAEWRCLTILNGGGSYINEKGQQFINISRGGWKLELPKSGKNSSSNNNSRKGMASQLQVWLNLENELERNDVRIPRGTRLYLSANCWREEEYDYGLDMIMMPIYEAAQASQRLLEETLNHDTGDRRLDGTNTIDTAMAYKDMAKLVRNRDETRRILKDASQLYPSPQYEDTHEFGDWPGSKELLLIHPSTVNIKLETKNKFLPVFQTEEYPIIGRWDIDPIFDDESDDDS